MTWDTDTKQPASLSSRGPALSVVQKFHANGTHWMWKQNGEGSSGPVSSGGIVKSTRETFGESFVGETKSIFLDEKNIHQVIQSALFIP